MAERSDPQIWVKRGAFAALVFAIIVIGLVPFDLRPAGWAGPDMLLAFTLAWIIRKPGYLPVLAIAALFLFADLLFLRPPGLWAALIVILTEFLRRQHRELRALPFLAEWGTITAGIIAITVLNRAILLLAVAPVPPLGLSLMQMAATILIYPVACAATHFIFGVRKAATGEIGNRGERL
ncbi:MAG: rod shape-determining protein MreD [Pseudomonadota bacterium]